MAWTGNWTSVNWSGSAIEPSPRSTSTHSIRRANSISLITALFHDMGMDWWTEQAEGLRGRLDNGQEFVWFAPYVDGLPSDT